MNCLMLMRLQEQFQHFLLTGHNEINESVLLTEQLSVETRLGIYREGYKLRLIESLTSSYPGVHVYLGTEEFEKLCGSYIDNYPSNYRSIRWYGHALADYIMSYYNQHNAYLVELADFEWKMTLAFDAADVDVVQVAKMASVPAQAWAGLQFVLHPSVHRINYFWNVIPIWQALMNEQEIPVLDKSIRAVPWLLWRSPDYVIQFYSMSEEEAWGIDALIQGLSFGELCEGFCQWFKPEEVAMRAASYLKTWIQNGVISRLQIYE